MEYSLTKFVQRGKMCNGENSSPLCIKYFPCCIELPQVKQNTFMKGVTIMKSLGIVRKIDELGRLVLPIETRRALGLASGEGVEIFVDGDRVILKKYEPACIFCGDADDIIVHNGKKICRNCAADIAKELR